MEWQKQGLTKSEYNEIHRWLRVNYSKSGCVCAHCKDSRLKLDYALIKGMRYERNIANYILLCKSCHCDYDVKTARQQILSVNEITALDYNGTCDMLDKLSQLQALLIERKRLLRPATLTPIQAELQKQNSKRFNKKAA